MHGLKGSGGLQGEQAFLDRSCMRSQGPPQYCTIQLTWALVSDLARDDPGVAPLAGDPLTARLGVGAGPLLFYGPLPAGDRAGPLARPGRPAPVDRAAVCVALDDLEKVDTGL